MFNRDLLEWHQKTFNHIHALQIRDRDDNQRQRQPNAGD